jgi:hypothetical protein
MRPISVHLRSGLLRNSGRPLHPYRRHAGGSCTANLRKSGTHRRVRPNQSNREFGRPWAQIRQHAAEDGPGRRPGRNGFSITRVYGVGTDDIGSICGGNRADLNSLPSTTSLICSTGRTWHTGHSGTGERNCANVRLPTSRNHALGRPLQQPRRTSSRNCIESTQATAHRLQVRQMPSTSRTELRHHAFTSASSPQIDIPESLLRGRASRAATPNHFIAQAATTRGHRYAPSPTGPRQCEHQASGKALIRYSNHRA